MIRIDANFLYKLGASINPVQLIRPDATKRQVLGRLVGVGERLDILLNKSVFRLVTSRIKGSELHQTVERIYDSLPVEGPEMDDSLDWLDHHLLTTQARDFETILAAELQWGQLFLVLPKGGYELYQLDPVRIKKDNQTFNALRGYSPLVSRGRLIKAHALRIV